ncbi:hypothetical protein AJ80_03606 [Polytolypa hystricis UAMH7299]|uniref:Metalloprotease m41 ftsh n=1 Tax=Polytolypa hystricis (strain UAMH7299) TaxID=1447883 RepID=A0A2B7YHF0_POLH7|nr:hypothetical protein AJ80_03606 [Polytolypa hystricis UAMH7299]
MSEYIREIQRLQRELEEAKARDEERRRELEEAKARDEERRRELEEAKARDEERQRKNQKTTLDEYLYNCHFHLYKKLALASKSKCTTGFTRVEGKYYPKWLRPWIEFTNSQRQHHFEVIRRACGEKRLFYQESTTTDIGTSISRKPAGNENAIDYFETLAVEEPVWEILRPIYDEEGLRREYRFTGLRFSNNTRDFSQLSDVVQIGEEDTSEERQERRRRTGPNKRVASEQRVKPPPTKPDGLGVRTCPGGDESLAFVYDYKAAHKFAVEYLKLALANEELFIEVIQRLNSGKSSNGKELQEREREEEGIAMALTQVFDYMVNYGVAYGYVASGKSLVFLHIDRADTQTLYYHLCVPDEEVGEPSINDWTNKVSRTAVAQLASFCLLSLRSDALEGGSLNAAEQEANVALRRWREPYEDAAHLLEIEDTDSQSAASLSQATDGSEFKSNAGPTGREVSLRSRSSCRAAAVLHRERKDDEEDESDGSQPRSWTRTDVNKRKEGPSSGSSEDEDAQMSDSAPTKQYCTQACLLALKRGWDLDGNCPNVFSHRTAESGNRHAIDAHELARLVGERLCKNPYRDCRSLKGWGKMGAIGVLFKLELAPYGYTFVAKGTLPGGLRHLEHESNIYARLDKLQGEVVPVHLGLVRLDQGYILPGGARVVHMMLMSWGGETAAEAGVPDMTAEVRRSSQAVWTEGVNHGDERDTNRLWNDERRRVMLVDFDRASLRPSPPNKRLSKLSGKKRKRQTAVKEMEGVRHRAPAHPIMVPPSGGGSPILVHNESRVNLTKFEARRGNVGCERTVGARPVEEGDGK